MDIVGAFRVLMYSIETAIFGLAIQCYELLGKFIDFNSFIKNASSIVENISESIYMLLAILMFFKLAFSLLSMLVDPNKINDKEQGAGKLVTGVIVVLVLIFMVPTAFKYLFMVQNKLFENKIIENIFYSGISETKQGEIKVNNVAEITSKNIHKAFLKPSESYEYLEKNGFSEIINNYKAIFDEGGNYLANSYLLTSEDAINKKRKVDNKMQYIFEYHPFLSFISSFIVLWIFISFTIDVATRSFRLFFLQILSPVAIVSYVDPKSSKSGIFKKWLDEVIKTYLSVFIRIATMTLISVIISELDLPSGEFIRNVFLLLGLLTFVKTAPKMLEKIFGIEARSKDENFGRSLLKGALAGGAAMTVGGLSGAVGAKKHGSSFFGGLAIGGGKGLTTGASSGYKGSVSGIAKSMFAGSAAVGKTYGYKTGMEKVKENMKLKSEQSFGNKQFESYNNKFKNNNLNASSIKGVLKDSKSMGYDLTGGDSSKGLSSLTSKEQKTLYKGLASSEAKASLIRDDNIREKVGLLEKQKSLEKIAKSRYKEEYTNFQMLGDKATEADKVKLIKAEEAFEGITGRKEGTKAELDLLLKRNPDSYDKKVLDALELGLTAQKPDEKWIDDKVTEYKPTYDPDNEKERQAAEKHFDFNPQGFDDDITKYEEKFNEHLKTEEREEEIRKQHEKGESTYESEDDQIRQEEEKKYEEESLDLDDDIDPREFSEKYMDKNVEEIVKDQEAKEQREERERIEEEQKLEQERIEEEQKLEQERIEEEQKSEQERIEEEIRQMREYLDAKRYDSSFDNSKTLEDIKNLEKELEKLKDK